MYFLEIITMVMYSIYYADLSKSYFVKNKKINRFTISVSFINIYELILDIMKMKCRDSGVLQNRNCLNVFRLRRRYGVFPFMSGLCKE